MKKTVYGSSAQSRLSISPSIDQEKISQKPRKNSASKGLPEKVQTLDFVKKNQENGGKYSQYKSKMQSKSDLEKLKDLSPEKQHLPLLKKRSSILNDDDVKKIYEEANNMLNEFRADHSHHIEPESSNVGKPKIFVRQVKDLDTLSSKLKKANTGRPSYDRVSKGSALDLENL